MGASVASAVCATEPEFEGPWFTPRSLVTCREECGCRNPADAAARESRPHRLRESHDDCFEAAMPVERWKVDFARIGAIPQGWRLSPEKAPEGFLFAGGAACVIEEIKSPLLSRRVLLVLPDSTVDLRRAKALTRLGGRTQGRILCRLWRASALDANDQAVLEFDLPSGESLDEVLERNGYLPEEKARFLCKELLELVTGFTNWMTLGGIIDLPLVYLNKLGCLSNLVPLGSVLSPRGLKAVAMSSIEQGMHEMMSPELKRAATGDGIPFSDEERCVTSDTYAVMALVLRAMMGIEPKHLREGITHATPVFREEVIAKPRCQKELSNSAKDLLHKALYEDPAWRLSGQDALSHPWLAKAGSI